ncbi:MAG: type III pantothenate kinase [Bacteroidota bacterium]
MNLVIDNGNTRIKVASFLGSKLHEKFLFATNEQLKGFLENERFEHGLVSSVSESAEEVLNWITCSGKKLSLSVALPLPITILYVTPETLGVDRMAAACGALEIFQDQNCLVIDAGTCINYEFLDKQANYHGGAISPGIQMRFEAMHKFTARLPLLKEISKTDLVGNSTESCMKSGVINGVLAEVNGIIDQYNQKFPRLRVILCGGDAHFFENNLKPPIFVAPDLVLHGLNRILLHNVNL